MYIGINFGNFLIVDAGIDGGFSTNKTDATSFGDGDGFFDGGNQNTENFAIFFICAIEVFFLKVAKSIG